MNRAPHLRQEEILELLFLMGQCDDPPIPMDYPDLFHPDVQLQLNGPEGVQRVKDHVKRSKVTRLSQCSQNSEYRGSIQPVLEEAELLKIRI